MTLWCSDSDCDSGLPRRGSSSVGFGAVVVVLVIGTAGIGAVVGLAVGTVMVVLFGSAARNH